MVLLLGASGYVGQAFARELRRRGCCFVPLSRDAFDYSCFEFLFDYVRKMKPEFLINAEGRCGRASEDACEQSREEALWANTILPQTVGRVCLMTNTPWGHVSSGAIYSGAKVVENGRLRIENDLTHRDVLRLFEAAPDRFYGFCETDEPNFSFRHAPCSFYSGTKALAEEAISDLGQSYIWRPHSLFNEQDDPCNWLSELQKCAKVDDQLNTVSHLDDCVRACLDLWERRAPFGVYNVANPGVVTMRQIAEMIETSPRLRRNLDVAGTNGKHAAGPRPSGCILDVSKILATGIRMRSAEDALEDALENWKMTPTRLSLAAERVPEPLPAAG